MQMTFSQDELLEIAKQVAIILQPKPIEKITDKYEHTYSVKEIARITNSTAQTVISHIANGRLKAKKAGKFWIVTQTSLNKYIGKDE
jgi:DNA-directed RNA polymerase specialized sigma24 family protein